MLKNPGNHQLVKESSKKAEDTTKENGEEQLESKGLNRNVDNGDSISESDSRTIHRSGSSEQTVVFKKVEQWDSKTKLNLETQLQADKRNVQEQNVTLEAGLQGNVTSEAIVRARPAVQEQHEENTVPYTNLTFSNNHDGQLNVVKTYSEGINTTATKEQRANKRNSERNNTEDVVSKEYRLAELELESLELAVPNLRRKF